MMRTVCLAIAPFIAACFADAGPVYVGRPPPAAHTYVVPAAPPPRAQPTYVVPSGPPPAATVVVPAGQVRREEVHERNAERQLEHREEKLDRKEDRLERKEDKLERKAKGKGPGKDRQEE
jgi:hypothetical protein